MQTVCLTGHHSQRELSLRMDPDTSNGETLRCSELLLILPYSRHGTPSSKERYRTSYTVRNVLDEVGRAPALLSSNSLQAALRRVEHVLNRA